MYYILTYHNFNCLNKILCEYVDFFNGEYAFNFLLLDKSYKNKCKGFERIMLACMSWAYCEDFERAFVRLWV